MLLLLDAGFLEFVLLAVSIGYVDVFFRGVVLRIGWDLIRFLELSGGAFGDVGFWFWDFGFG